MNKIIINSILQAFLSPVLFLVKVLKSKNEQFITVGGTIFMGFIGSVFAYVPGSDGATYLSKVEYMYMDMSLGEFFDRAYRIITFNAAVDVTDMYLHVLGFIAGAIFGIPELLHAMAGLILGYFYTKSVLLVLRNAPVGRKSVLLTAMIFFLLIIHSITALNAFRMWTGMWVLFYGSYSWLLTKKVKYVWVTLLAVGFHFSYSVIIVPVMIGYFIRNRKMLVIAVYIMSFIFNLNFFSVSGYIPDLALLEMKERTYVKSEDQLARLQEVKSTSSNRFYKEYGIPVYVNYSIVGLSFMLMIFYFRNNVDRSTVFLFAVGLTMYAFSNIVGFSPSLSGRTKTISGTYLLAVAVHLACTVDRLNLSKIKIRIVKSGYWLFMISSIPMILFQMSYIINNVSPFVIIFPVVSWVLGDNDVTIREALGWLI